MGSFLQTFSFVMISLFLLWFGYTLFFRAGNNSPAGTGKKRKALHREVETGLPGSPQTCPVCSARLEKGERVKSTAFPSFTGKDRMMFIRGCFYCLEGDRDRTCPVCGAVLDSDDILIARMFERPGRSHVHVLGCSRCREDLAPKSSRAMLS
jgi:predicted nucleic acid-binding Zn ribbon protein